jgi:RNA polymerase sigma-70 factor (ECF subfamily)
MGARGDEAEDVVQETWQRAAGRVGAFEWRSALSTWLSGILINCARERLRKPGVEPMDPVAIDLLVARAAREPAIDLERAIAALPDGYREVFVLHDVEGLTHEEIASRLDVAAGTSKSQLFHARRALRARLAPARSER